MEKSGQAQVNAAIQQLQLLTLNKSENRVTQSQSSTASNSDSPHSQIDSSQHKTEESKKDSAIPALTQEQLRYLELAANLQIVKRNDDYRLEKDTHSNGGFALTDKTVLSKYRSAGKDLIKQVGKQIFTGKFNLTTVSLPIRVMDHKTVVELVASIACLGPAYLNAAALAKDPIERMKYVMLCSVAFIGNCHSFDKPLNPILGETYEGLLPDGSKVFMEQVSHRPPISYMLHEGPDNLYRFSGYSSFSAKAWLNSIELKVTGQKTVVFPKDGTKITFNNQSDLFQNTFIGTLNHQITGKVEFIDHTNGIYAWYEIGNVKKKTQDFFSGEIMCRGQKASEVYGNYLGFIDFDGKRYWDIREQHVYPVQGKTLEQSLASDSRRRPDSIQLIKGNIELAQENKDAMENIQRKDKELRENAEKRREKGGPKYMYPWEHKGTKEYDGKLHK